MTRDLAPILPQLWRLLAPYRGFGYGPRVADSVIDCSTLTASILRSAWGRDVVTPEVWRDLQIMDPDRPWSPMDAIGRITGRGAVYPRYGPEMPEPGRLHLMQGWTGLGPGGRVAGNSRGHAWLWVSFGVWRGMCVESSGMGPRVWDAHGIRPLSDAVSADGRLIAPVDPMDLGVRARKWSDGIGWAVLP